MFVRPCYNTKLMYVPSKNIDISVDKSFWEPDLQSLQNIYLYLESVKIKDPCCILFKSEFSKDIFFKDALKKIFQIFLQTLPDRGKEGMVS